MMISPSPFLRRVLIVDAAASAAAGAAMTLGANVAADVLGLPADLLRYAGIALLPFAALVAWIATRAAVPRAAVWAVIAANALWTLDSLWLLASGWVAPTALGTAYVLAQAALVAGFAELEYLGLRRAVPAAA